MQQGINNANIQDL